MNNREVNSENILDTLEGAQLYLGKVSRYKHIISDDIREDNIEESFKKFKDLIEGLTYLNKLLENISSMIYMNYSREEHKGKPIENYINEFNKFLDKIVFTMEKEDYILLADLVEYEFDKYLDLYSEIFNKIIENVNHKGLKLEN